MPGDRQPVKYAAPVVIDHDNCDVGQVVLPNRHKTVHVMVEGNITQNGDDMLSGGRGKPQSRGNIAVYTTRSAIAIDCELLVTRPIEGIHVSYRHAVSGEEYGIIGREESTVLMAERRRKMIFPGHM